MLQYLLLHFSLVGLYFYFIGKNQIKSTTFI